MAIQKEIFSPIIQENLTKGMEAIAFIATDETNTFLNAKTVHIPASGALGGVIRGATSLPVAVTSRSDNDLTYELTDFKIPPTNVEWMEKFQLAYDKMASITKDLTGNLSQDVAKYLMSQWYYKAAGSLVATSGTTTTTNWLGGSATGSLKHITGADVRTAAKIMDGQNVKSTDRFLLLDYEMYWQLLGDISYNAERVEVIGGLQSTVDLVYGFKVIQMPYVASVNTSDVIKVPAAADGSFTFAATDRPIGLAIQKECASFAMSPIEVLLNEKDPTYYGSIMSSIVYAGGKYRRYDGKGSVAIRATS